MMTDEVMSAFISCVRVTTNGIHLGRYILYKKNTILKLRISENLFLVHHLIVIWKYLENLKFLGFIV